MAITTPILITGAPRSGTTFVGQMLALPREVIYLSEPFNKEIGIEGIDRAFAYLDDSNSADVRAYDEVIEGLLTGRSRFRINPYRDAQPSTAKRAARVLFRSKPQLQYQLDTANPFKHRYLVKDPMACFASQYLQRHFSMQTVIIVRHPASTIASYKRLGWRYNLHELTDQTNLMDRYLGPVLGGLTIENLTEIEEWSYLWLAIYTVLDAFLRDNPDMIMVRHEDLSLNPTSGFRALYQELGLEFTSKVRATIDRHTRAGNPIDPTGNKAHVLRRDSAKNLDRWRRILEPDEIAEITRLTGPLARKYYPSDHWW